MTSQFMKIIFSVNRGAYIMSSTKVYVGFTHQHIHDINSSFSDDLQKFLDTGGIVVLVVSNDINGMFKRLSAQISPLTEAVFVISGKTFVSKSVSSEKADFISKAVRVLWDNFFNTNRY